eukprot:m.88275 g.88275  ORF g.88275 m.88275 type:complete len:562 (+) comp8804_c0_seq1:25-1710(+)
MEETGSNNKQQGGVDGSSSSVRCDDDVVDDSHLQRHVKLLVTFAGGFEDCVVGELLEKVPECHILGPFLKNPIERRERKEIVEQRRKGEPHVLDATTNNSSALEESHFSRGSPCSCRSGNDSNQMIASRLNREGFLVFETHELHVPFVVENIMTVKAVYVFVASVDIPHTIDGEALKVFLGEFITSDEAFDLKQASRLWTSLYGATCGIWHEKRQKEIYALLNDGKEIEDDDDERGSDIQPGNDKRQSDSTHADFGNVTKRSKKIICNMPTDEKATDLLLTTAASKTIPRGYDFQNVVGVLDSGPTFRASVQKIHRKAYPLRRQDMAGPIGAGIQARFGWGVNLAEYNLDILAIMGNMPRVGYFGLLLSDAVSINLRHRVVCGFSSLQTFISSCLVRMANPKPGQTIYDPMCGTATIPVEGACEYPKSFFIGSDLDYQSIAIAKNNISFAILDRDPNVDVFVADSSNIPLESGVVDTIVCDMPWGRRCGSAKINRQFYPKFIKEWHRLVKPGGKVLTLTLERNLMKKLIEQQEDTKGLFSIENERLVDIGLEVTVMALVKL